MELESIVKENVANTKLIYVVFASPFKKTENKYKKVTVKPISKCDCVAYQLEKFTDTQAFHENYESKDIVQKIIELASIYKNTNIFTVEADYQVLSSKSGNIKIIKNKPTKTLNIDTHNKTKQYIIHENEPCDFLIELGVMSSEGKVLAKKYDKFKQINKFLEIVDDALGKKALKDEYRIIDFGCGKAYLTFALYYYFKKIKNTNVKIVGLDLKTDVINFCNNVSQKLGYNELVFENGDIKNYNNNLDVDMVVTLHACDNATDAALVKAIKWKTDIILSVPCCQHEFFDKIDNSMLNPMLKHGLIKERMSSLVTDSLRGLFLESKGYKVQMVEFVDFEHTPKNIMIRAVKDKIKTNSEIEYEQFKKFWNLQDIFIDNYYTKEIK